jgi:hypothetical protein
MSLGGVSSLGVTAGGFLSDSTEEGVLPGKLTIFNELGLKNEVAKFFFFFKFSNFQKKIFFFKKK